VRPPSGTARQRTAGTDRPGTGSGIASAPAGTDPTQATLRLSVSSLSLSRARGLALALGLSVAPPALLLTASPSTVAVVSVGSSSPAPFRAAPLSRLRLCISEIPNPNHKSLTLISALRTPALPPTVPRHRLRLRAPVGRYVTLPHFLTSRPFQSLTLTLAACLWTLVGRRPTT
jgi:hypothetical protein